MKVWEGAVAIVLVAGGSWIAFRDPFILGFILMLAGLEIIILHPNRLQDKKNGEK